MTDDAPPFGGVGKHGRLPRVFEDEENGSRATETKSAFSPVRRAPRSALTVLDGRSVGSVYEIKSDGTWIGRDPECEVMLRDRGVSRRHASLNRVGADLVLRDLKAKNGTYVNGVRIAEHELRRGDEIQLGCSVRLLYTYTFASGADEVLEQQ